MTVSPKKLVDSTAQNSLLYLLNCILFYDEMQILYEEFTDNACPKSDFNPIF